MYNNIKIELQGVHQGLQSSHAISTTPLTIGTIETEDELGQFHQITDKVEARLR